MSVWCFEMLLVVLVEEWCFVWGDGWCDLIDLFDGDYYVGVCCDQYVYDCVVVGDIDECWLFLCCFFDVMYEVEDVVFC